MTAILLSSLSSGYAQEFSMGPAIGISNSWIQDAPGDTEGLLGFNAGLALVYSTEEHWGIGIDLKYSAEGVQTKFRGETLKTHLNYVRVPLKVIYFFNKFGNDFRPKIYVGPSLGFLAGGKTKRFVNVGVLEFDSKDLYEDFDLGLTFGTGFNYRIATRTWLNLDLAYSHGFVDIDESVTGYNRNLNLSVGVAWGL